MNKDTKFWNDRYEKGGNSDYGSYGTQAQFKLDKIKEHVSDINSILSIGCGDFAFDKRLLELFPEAKYVGMDTSNTIIELNKKTYPNINFALLNKPYFQEEADLALCIDVLFHISDEKECQKLLNSLKKSWNKYLVLTACEYGHEKLGMADSAAMFDEDFFGKPIFKELVEPENSQFGYLYIWKKDQK